MNASVLFSGNERPPPTMPDMPDIPARKLGDAALRPALPAPATPGEAENSVFEIEFESPRERERESR